MAGRKPTHTGTKAVQRAPGTSTPSRIKQAIQAVSRDTQNLKRIDEIFAAKDYHPIEELIDISRQSPGDLDRREHIARFLLRAAGHSLAPEERRDPDAPAQGGTVGAQFSLILGQ